jgi:folate-binding protein YgfZ
MHRLALHGPTGKELLMAVARQSEDAPGLGDLTPNTATVVTIADREVIVEREDTAGEVGLELTMSTDDALAVYRRLIELGSPINGEGPDELAGRVKLRPSGWLAYNTARIEAGTPLFHIDFSSRSLPAETGVLDERVSFTKGCYLGQEVVARMHALGKPKQILVALKPEGPDLRGADGHPRQPLGGSHVLPAGDRSGDPIGIITSSTISPMLGGEPICFAIVKTKHAEPGTELALPAEGTMLKARVRDSLTFHSSV